MSAKYEPITEEQKPASWYVSSAGRKDRLQLVDRTIAVLQKAPFAQKAIPLAPKLLTTATVGGKPLPATLARFLAYDRSFRSIPNPLRGKPAALPLVDSFGTKGALPSAITMEEAIHRHLDTVKPVVARSKRVLSDGENHLLTLLPKQLLYPLPYLGEDAMYLFLGIANAEGEYPIIALHIEAMHSLEKQSVIELDQVVIEVVYPAFDLYLAGNLVRNIPDVTGEKAFVELCRKQARKNKLL
jgi:hypothetical protein